MTFKEFLLQRKSEYLLPLGGPLVVFILSFFVTNIGLLAIPMGLGVMALVGGIKTLDLYNRWYVVENIVKAAKNGDPR